MAAVKKARKVAKRVKTGMAAAPHNDFYHFKQYVHTDIDKAEYSAIIKSYLKKTLSKEDYKIASANPEYVFGMFSHVAATIYWKEVLEKEFPESWNDKSCITRYVDQVLASGRLLYEETKNEIASTAPNVVQLTPQQHLAKKVNNTIMYEYDDMIDKWLDGEKATMNMYERLKYHDLKGGAAKFIRPTVQSQRDEYADAYNKTCEDATEAYSHIDRSVLKYRIGVLDKMLADIDSFEVANKATRTPRKKQAKSADKQVAKVKYQKEDHTYKLASINPATVPGAVRLYTFNTSTRKLTEYVTTSVKGFEISGTSIKNFDPELSRTITVRKPEEVLPAVTKQTPNQIDKLWKSLTTVTTVPNGRLNETTVLLRVLHR